MFLGYNYSESMVVVYNSEENRYPMVQGYIRLVSIKGQEQPSLVVHLHKAAPVDQSKPGNTMAISDENKAILKDMTDWMLKELLSTLGNSFLFIEDSNPYKIYRFSKRDSGSCGSEYYKMETDLELDEVQ
jgi:hypothetical protein